jgi:hypothetical protein
MHNSANYVQQAGDEHLFFSRKLLARGQIAKYQGRQEQGNAVKAATQ